MTITDDLPTRPRSFRLSELDYAHLVRLQEMVGRRSQTDVVGMALTHLLATMQRDERVHLRAEEESGEHDR